ncbi:hypothetical protein [Algoriphagus winogradskyi]|uniref:Lipocalin-like domain-containing protein n=1 Tax=Algoriphagus winogradskyi TaxID=237017 RepID=A0ABY1NRJ1_9BACT|nr:hypothetical protein [Algoriphagus winogradskyi]SMP16144.1 hypothetical protein SAMN06265367_102583 [Algoriphagus winogradskyi]
MKNSRLLLFLFLSLSILATSCSKDDDDPEVGGCSTVCTGTIASGETAGTVAPSIVGKYSLTMQYAAANSPFPDGTVGEFEVYSDNKLYAKIGDKCVTISNPIQSGTAEVVFKDNCVFNLKFGVSEKNGGGLNEINIGSNTEFLGQFHL